MDQTGLVGSLVCLVTEWLQMAAGNANRSLTSQEMDGNNPILTTMNGDMPLFDKETMV